MAEAWVNPDSFIDHGNWLNETLIWDGNTGTDAINNGSFRGTWCNFIDLVKSSPIWCSKVRFWAKYSGTYICKIDLDVYYSGAWHDVYEGTYANLQYVEKELGGTYNVEKARIKFWNCKTNEDVNAEFYEFDFWESESPTFPYSQAIIIA